jgi:hypothetical protein
MLIFEIINKIREYNNDVDKMSFFIDNIEKIEDTYINIEMIINLLDLIDSDNLLTDKFKIYILEFFNDTGILRYDGFADFVIFCAKFKEDESILKMCEIVLKFDNKKIKIRDFASILFYLEKDKNKVELFKLLYHRLDIIKDMFQIERIINGLFLEKTKLFFLKYLYEFIKFDIDSENIYNILNFFIIEKNRFKILKIYKKKIKNISNTDINNISYYFKDKNIEAKVINLINSNNNSIKYGKFIYWFNDNNNKDIIKINFNNNILLIQKLKYFYQVIFENTIYNNIKNITINNNISLINNNHENIILHNSVPDE